MTMGSTGLEDGITRRQLLIGAGAALGALAVAGVVAQRTLPLRAYWYQWTGQCGPDGPVPEDLATPAYGAFRSEVLGTDVEYGVWAPSVIYPQGDRIPVLYCLPARGQGPRWVLDGPVYLADFAAVDEPGGAHSLALVSVDGGDTYWHERASGEDRMAMLLDEFIPWYEEEHDVGGSRARRAVMGWSMGGYGALLAAERRPDMFAAVCAASPALWYQFSDGVGDAFDDECDFEDNNVFTAVTKLFDTAVRVDCGRSDVFYDAALDFSRSVQGIAGAQVTGDVADGVKGCHTPGYWRRVAPAELDFVHAALSAARGA